MSSMEITGAERLRQLSNDLLLASPQGRTILTRAHRAMAKPVIREVKRRAPRDETPPRSAASLAYGPLSRRVEAVDADESGVTVRSPWYAILQDRGRYVHEAAAAAMPEAREAFARSIRRSMGMPGGGWLAWRGIDRVAQAGRWAAQTAVEVLVWRRAKLYGAVAGRAAGQVALGGLRGLSGTSFWPVTGAVRAVRGGVRDWRSFTASYESARLARLAAASRRVPLVGATALGAEGAARAVSVGVLRSPVTVSQAARARGRMLAERFEEARRAAG